MQLITAVQLDQEELAILKKVEALLSTGPKVLTDPNVLRRRQGLEEVAEAISSALARQESQLNLWTNQGAQIVASSNFYHDGADQTMIDSKLQNIEQLLAAQAVIEQALTLTSSNA